MIKVDKTEKNLNISHRFWFRLIFHNIYLFIFHLHSLDWYNLASKAIFILIKLTLFEVSKKAVFLQFFEIWLNDMDTRLTWFFGIDKNIIYINNDKNIKILKQDLINIILKTGQSVRELKRHYLVLKVTVLSLKSLFQFIAFFYHHLMVSTCEIKLDELFG